MSLREQFLKIRRNLPVRAIEERIERRRLIDEKSPLPASLSSAGSRKAEPRPDGPRTTYNQVKNRLHRRLIEEFDPAALWDGAERSEIRDSVAEFVRVALESDPAPLSRAERSRLAEDLLYETFGLGPLGPLMCDPAVSDILVNGADQVYVERFGRLERTTVAFNDAAHVLQIIERIVAKVGRHIDELNPMVDARLPDGSRVNAIIPPLSLSGPILSIRRFTREPLRLADLKKLGTLDDGLSAILERCVMARLSLLITGGTGSGKTTLLNVLSSFIPNSERIVTIEDAAELRIQQEHWVSLETRPPNIEGRGQVTARDLVRNALRMRPDRLVIGEVRGAEALDMLQALNTGHDGGMSTLHANAPREALSRLETMVLMAGFDLPQRAIREQIASAVDVIVHVARFPDGSRKVTSLSEVVGMEASAILLQEIYRFRQTGIGPDRRVLGTFEPTGVRPAFSSKLELTGLALPPDLFDPRSGPAA